MIQVTPQMRILVAVEPADFRKGIDGLARLCRKELGSDPFSGALFVFRNRRRTAIKLVVYDGQGFWLLHNYLTSHYTSSGSSDRLDLLRSFGQSSGSICQSVPSAWCWSWWIIAWIFVQIEVSVVCMANHKPVLRPTGECSSRDSQTLGHLRGCEHSSFT
jgi:hypothetical protein